MSETLVIVLLTGGPLLWMIGGIRPKWVRRFAWPLVVAVCLAMSGTSFASVIIASLLLVAVNTLPYGDRTPGWLRPVVFTSYGLPAIAIHPSILTAILFPLLTGGVLTLVFMASRRWNWLTWKIWEGLAGFLQAATLIMAVLMQ